MSQGVGDVPYVKVYNLTFDGNLDFSVNPTFVDVATHRVFLARSTVLPGDVLTNIVGPPLGKVSIVPKTHPEWNINQAIARYRPLNGLLGTYLSFVLSSMTFVEWAKARSKATAGQFNLTLEICRDAPIPMPPIAEQARIAERTARTLSLVLNVGKSCERHLARCLRLRQSILKWAFEGRLVDQDPSDQPASALLARIRAERTPLAGQPNEQRPTVTSTRTKRGTPTSPSSERRT
jgi:type I restriction enzyme S subunit